MGTCVACTSSPASAGTYDYTSPGVPSTSNNCMYQCKPLTYLTSTGTCATLPSVLPCSTQPNNGSGYYIDAQGACKACNASLLAPANAVYPNPGISCDWRCKSNFFRNASNLCQACKAVPSSGSGKYMYSPCSSTADTVIQDCSSFPASHSQVGCFFLLFLFCLQSANSRLSPFLTLTVFTKLEKYRWLDTSPSK